MENLQLGTMPCKIGLPKVRDQEVGGSNPLAPTNPREFSMKSMSCSGVLRTVLRFGSPGLTPGVRSTKSQSFDWLATLITNSEKEFPFSCLFHVAPPTFDLELNASPVPA